MPTVDVQFPPVEWADPETGLLCVGGDLSPETLIAAYRSGIFPWPLGHGDELYWFAPEQRAVLFFDEMHIPRSLRKQRNRALFEIRINMDFPEIITRCASTRTSVGEKTWITPRMIEAYESLFKAGFAKCVGAYRDGQLVGGIYGVSIAQFFAGESMFYQASDASKLALWALVEHLRELGLRWMDCQQKTPVLSRFGARLLPRAEFMVLLKSVL